MTKTRNKGKTRRVIPAGAVLTVADIRKLPKRSQGPKKNPIAKIKWALRSYISKCPHPAMTSTTKRVGILLADWYMPDKRYARASKATIADELSIGTASVSRALKTLHDLEIVFTKSGGPSRRGSLGAVANKYMPNFRLVINSETGAIIKNANYDFSAANPRGYQESLYQNDTMKSLYQNDTRSKRSNPRGCQESLYQNDTPYSYISAGANASPCASADAAATASAAPRKKDQKKQSGNGIPLPPDSETVKIRFVRVGELASALEFDPEDLLELIDGKGLSGDMTAFDDLCKHEIFNFGAPGQWILDYQLPPDVTRYGHVIIHGDKGKVDFVNGGPPRLKFDNLKRSSWLAIEYRVSSDYQDELTAKLKALRGRG